MCLGIGVNGSLKDLPRVTDSGEKKDSGEKAEKLLKDIGRLLSGKRDRCSHRCSPLKNKPYQGMCLRTPARTNAASVKAASTAHVSSERFRRRKLLVSCFDIGSLLIRN
jgi:hypothetical protein